MPTIQELLTLRNSLITEDAALNKLGLPITPANREWIRRNISHRPALIPDLTMLYYGRDVDQCLREAEMFECLVPPSKRRRS